MGDIEKVRDYFEGLLSGDPALTTKHLDSAGYVEHDPRIADGVEGVRRFAEEIADSQPVLKVIRAFQDGDYVFAQADGHVGEDGVFFDVFRLEGGRIIEHWGFSAPAGPPNKSGHTQVDGPTEPEHVEHTEKNKAFVRDYYRTVHLAVRHDLIPQYVSGDQCIRHEPSVADGLEAFIQDVEVLTRDRTIDEIRLLVGRGDLVFVAAKGTHQGEACAYIDLYRVEDDKVVEHWGFPKPYPPRVEQRNDNAML